MIYPVITRMSGVGIFQDDIICILRQNPLMIIANPGYFDILLVAAHNGCSDSLRIEDYITVFEPVSRFVTEYNCEDPYTVTINNFSIGADSFMDTTPF